MREMIPVFRPQLLGEPRQLLQTLASSWWGTGPRVEEFEREFGAYTGLPGERCLMVNSGTAALHLALKLYPDCRRVLVPALTFVSSALPARYERAELVFVDVGDDLCLDADDVLNKVRHETDVIVAVHLGGQVVDLSRLAGLRVIEDCAHALGSREGDRHVGTANLGCFSFQATKVLPIGDGGMLMLVNEEQRGRASALSWCGIGETTWERVDGQYQWQYWINEVGYKYRANDLQAALALDQLPGLDGLLARKRRIADLYGEALAGLDWLTLPKVRSGTSPNWQEFTVRMSARDALVAYLRERGISTTVHYYPIHRYRPFLTLDDGLEIAYPLPNTDRLWKEILTIPSHASLTDEEINRVVDGIRGFRP